MRTVFSAQALGRGVGVTAWILAAVLGVANGAMARSAEPAAAEKPSSVTTADPAIPEDCLELLLKPLTKEELAIEADAWRDLLKTKVQGISHLRIELKTRKNEAEKTKEAKDAENTKKGETEQPAPKSPLTRSADAAKERKQQLADSLPGLNEEKAQLVNRLDVVLEELEAKGGDVESYRKYIGALSGVGVEVTDTATAWTVLKGWLLSVQGGQRWAWNICKFLLILIAFYFGASIVAGFVRHAASRVKGASQLLVNFLGKFVKQLLMVIGLVVALAALEVNIAPLLAAIGAAGFVVGFALKDTLSNFASGLLILAYQPFDVGDVIEAAGVSGSVDSVSLFATHVRTFDNKMMVVPNNDIWGGTITNATASNTRRVDMVFGIGYEDDIAKAKGILERLVNEHELVLDEPAPVVKLHELADSSLNFICRPWTKTGDYWTVYWDLIQAVKEEFDRAGLSIPYPQRDVHVYHEAAPADSE